MSLRINQNSMAESSSLHLNRTRARLETSISRLSSGLRILNAGDDAAGLAISETMRRQIRGLDRAGLNAQDGISMVQTAEGALGETQSIIQRMRELALASANDTLTGDDRMEIQNEVDELKKQIESISNSTEFNTKRLLNGNRAALTSSGSESVKAIARGAVSESGSYTISLATMSGGVAQLQQSALFSAKDGGSVSGATKLSEISAFYNESGFMLDSSRNIYLTGNGKSAAVSVNGSMTLNDLASSFQNALVSGLGLTGSSASFMAGSDGKSGVMNLISGLRGQYGNFGIAGNQTIADALGFTVARQSVNSQVSVNISDSYGNSKNVVTSENVVSGLLEGIDVKFTSQAAQISGVGGIVDGVKLDAKQNFTLDLGDDELTITVAAGDWSLEGIVRSINSQAEDAGSAIKGKGVSATAVDGNLRISYNPTDPGADGTFTVKSSNAAKLGIVDNNYTGFADGNINAESRVRGVSKYNADADSFAVKFAVDGMAITAYQTVSAATAADLKTVSELTSEINAKLGSSAKFEVINDALTFTDYQIGNNGTSNSVLTLTMTASSTLAAELKDKFGLEAGTAYGSGDSKANLKIADSASRFQLGAGSGDMMRLAIGDMSLSGLGLDNLDLTTAENSQKALDSIDKALARVSSERARMGSYMNRLGYSINVAQNTSFNLSAAESRIRDADMAAEVINLAKYQLLNEAGSSVFNQANIIPKSIMKLLGSE